MPGFGQGGFMVLREDIPEEKSRDSRVLGQELGRQLRPAWSLVFLCQGQGLLTTIYR